MNRLNKIVKILKNDGVVILPTDTVYGLFAVSTSKKAIEKIYDIKRRKLNKPLQIFLHNKKQILKYAVVNKRIKKEIDKYLPGKFTLILKLKKKMKKIFTFASSAGTIGIRIIEYKFLKEILRKINEPLAATSANISGESPPLKFKEIKKEILKKIDFFIKNDSIISGRPSSIIDLTSRKIKILR